MNKRSRFYFLRSFWHLLAGVLLVSITVYLWETDSYGKFRDVEVTVVDRLASQGRYSATFYLIVENDEYGRFDIPVRPTLYQTAKNGEKLVFNLRPFDIRQTPYNNMVYVFGQIIIWILLAFYIVGCIVEFFKKPPD